MFFSDRIIITFNSFPNEYQNIQVFTHSDLKMAFSFAIIGSTPAMTLEFVNIVRMSEWWNSVFKCKKVTNFALSLKNKLYITVQ